MKLKHKIPVSYEIKKRTFEGKTDPSKNFNSLTSKYMTSYKYWMEITFKDESKEDNTFVKKSDAVDYYERRKKQGGKAL